MRKRPKSKKLINKGDLLNSITCKVVNRWSAFVGVLRQARRRDSSAPMVNIAKIHEFGFRGTVASRLTTGSSRAGSQSGGSHKVVIPARPYLFPTLEKIKNTLFENWRKAVARAIDLAH